MRIYTPRKKKNSSRLVTKSFTGAQTGSLVNFCEAYEKKYGIDNLRKVRVTAVGMDIEDNENKRIQGYLIKYTNDGYVRNISVVQDRTGNYFIVACSTAKFERIAANSITLEYSWDKDIETLLIKYIPRVDERIIHMVMNAVKADYTIGSIRYKRGRGLPRGSPLSPLLANLFLDSFF